MPKQPRMPNMQQMLQQVQKMQQEMEAAQEQLKDEIVEASAGGGMVTVRVSGDLAVKSIAIDPDAVDPDDPSSPFSQALRRHIFPNPQDARELALICHLLAFAES